MSSFPRSCIECRRRKIKCNRDQPCGYCTRVQIECVYPAVEGSNRQQRLPLSKAGAPRNTEASVRMQLLEDQLHRLEARLSEVESQSAFGSLSSNIPQSSSPTSSRQASPACSTDLWLDSPGPSSLSLRPSPSIAAVMPQLADAHVARYLWNIYLTDIDPFMKLVDHQFVEDTLLTYPQTSADGKALLLAIFFATRACEEAIPVAEYQSYAKAVEVAMQSANMLSQPSLPTLQALTIYLTCSRLHMNKDYLCTMLSLLVQMATKLQLHRDPAELGYLAKESEHRRRLWWYIVSLDVRTAEACGSDPVIQDLGIGMKKPVMVQDAALRSKAVFAPTHHEPCSFYAVVAVEMADIAKKILFFPEPNMDKASRARLSDQLHQDLLDKHTSYCKCINSPVCRLTVEWCKIYLTRLKLLLLHWDKVFLRRVANAESTDPNGDLVACVDILERVQALRADIEYARWGWLWQNCVEWDVSAVALSTIAAGKCRSELVTRAWVAIDSFFATSTRSFGDPERQKRWRELETFKEWVRASQTIGS